MTESLSHVQLLRSHGLVACKASPAIGFPSQKYWSGLPFPPPRDIHNSEIEPISSEAPALASRFFFTDEPPGKPHVEILLAITSTHSVLLHLL